eukprot:TRINITY_DN5151_c0_g2_i1.p1 TRINITY_DN5151_c0_g2~~TRINITY_DN5151_c0_g2_i1.p1  ORF type:complete len:410 (+),score=111.32 TRINITY_DN5151_c0_g2_i1:25-1230(+)
MRIVHFSTDAFLHPAFLHGHKIKAWTKTHKPSKVVMGHVMLFCVQVIFSAHNLTGRYAMQHVSPIVYMAIRLVVGAPIMIALAGVIDKKKLWVSDWKAHVRMAAIGIIGVAGNPLSFMFGLKLASASVGAVISPSQVVMTFIASVILRREKANILKVLGVTTAMCGVLVGMQLDKMNSSSVIGPMCFIGSALANAIYFLLQGPLLKTLAPEIIMAWSFAYATVPLAILAFTIDFPGMQSVFDGSLPGTVIVALLYAVFFVQIAAFNMLSFGIKYSGSPTIASGYSLLNPVLTIALSIIIMGEPFVWMQTLGCAITIVGLIILIVGRQREMTQASEYQPVQPGEDVELGRLLKDNKDGSASPNMGDLRARKCTCHCHEHRDAVSESTQTMSEEELAQLLKLS